MDHIILKMIYIHTSNVNVVEAPFSDHEATFMTLSTCCQKVHKVISYRQINPQNIQDFQNGLSSLN